MHNVPYVGHPGYKNTLKTIKKDYYYPSMKKEVVGILLSAWIVRE